MTTQRTDDELVIWLNSAEYQRRADTIDQRADDDGHFPKVEELAEFLDLPLDIAGGILAKALYPERFAEFRRNLQ